ncbi:MAG: ABC transporter ATP-binding protein [Rubrivivax sp.]|nr:MAG: ABC transporter ATP-binding protein [Rubrivivax sp.]
MLDVLGLTKRYGPDPVFAHVNLTVAPGEFVAIVGESGVGKSTLLNCLAGLDGVDEGRVVLGGIDITTLDETAQAHFRRRQLGFVFQAFHVLPHLSVAQNVGLPLMLLGENKDAAAYALRVNAALESVGLEALGERLPQQLSGGQLQRVAIARALIHKPALLLADEPTGNLDPDTADKVMNAFVAQIRAHGTACVMVTHSPSAARRADRVLRLTVQGLLDHDAA